MPHTNRLAQETSPYLRQHAENPVEWNPWGAEAFEEARRRDVPILLSVGYSACHWCHVMAHQSFEDPATAAVMNQTFVNIKVDREERPDIDGIYMEAVQAISGSGGWPMTVFLLPDGRPFFGGTYYPRDRFVELMSRIAEAWQTKRAALEADAGHLADSVRARTGLPELSIDEGERSTSPIDAGVEALVARFDPEWGGFGNAPKFPQPCMLELLLQAYARDRDPAVLEVVTTTLDAMASGGIYDHLAGGFARYSTDRRWLVPHFEKMLYDNALLTRVYLHAWQATGEPRYRQVVEETIGYLLAPPMRQAGAGFSSAEDADSEGVEGRFYVWGRDELQAVAGAEATAWYGVTAEGNWEGTNILRRAVRGDLLRPEAVEAGRRALLAVRERRVRPGLDDKVLTEWNAMAVAALAEAGAALGQEAWVAAAVAVAEFLLAALRRPDGRWLRSWQHDPAVTRPQATSSGATATAPPAATTPLDPAVTTTPAPPAATTPLDPAVTTTPAPPAAATPLDPSAPPAAAPTPPAGRAQHLAYASDHAWLVEAFTRLAEATGRSRWISEARTAADELVRLFWDDQAGGFHTAGSDAEALIARPKDTYDGALPSANSVAATALLRLAALTGELSYRDLAERLLAAMGPALAKAPSAFATMVGAADLAATGITEVAITGRRPDLVAAARAAHRPQVVLAWGERYPSPIWEGRDALGAAGLAYVCRDWACQAPVGDPEALLAALAPAAGRRR